MMFHENRLLADHSHEISYLNFYSKLGKMPQNLSSAAVVIGALRVQTKRAAIVCYIWYNQKGGFRNYYNSVNKLFFIMIKNPLFSLTLKTSTKVQQRRRFKLCSFFTKLNMV